MKKSNLYIEKIYKDHPIACWPLDDEINYRQLLSQNISNWTITGGTFGSISDNNVAPIMSNTLLRKINFSNSVTVKYSSQILNLLTNPQKEDVTFSIYIYHTSSVIAKYEIGIITNNIEYYSEYSFGTDYGWHNILDTFQKSNINSTTRIFIKAFTSSPSSVYFYINAPSLGQESEEFCSYSFGYTATINQTELVADEYGRNSENNGVYALDEYLSPYVRQGGIPLAYGSYQSLRINDQNCTAMRFPGSGFLHETGKNKNYTLEFWTRLTNSSINPIRIVGPNGSQDGIYLEEGFISVYLGPYTQSYFVGKWYRPMLIHFEYSPKSIALLINGEKVISIDINIDRITFNQYSDEITFFGSEYVDPFEIDSIALYPYMMPVETAKKHFVYGQGVQQSDFSNDKFLKKNYQIDFPFAQYSFNTIYPDTNKWRSGFSSNLDSSSTYLKPSQYKLPEIICINENGFVNSDDWLLKNSEIIPYLSSEAYPYFVMLPSPYYFDASIYFKNISVFPQKLRSIFGVFKSPETPQSFDQILMSFVNKQTNQSFQIILNENTLRYLFFDSAGQEIATIFNEEQINDDSIFYAGIDISTISKIHYQTIRTFFSNIDKISLNVGGGKDAQTFFGKIFSVNFVNQATFKNHFSNNDFYNGIIVQDTSAIPKLISYIADYSFIPIYSNTSMAMDVATNAYWEDSIPLSMFGKNIDTPTGKQYDLDIIQFNIDAQYKQIYDKNFAQYSLVSSLFPESQYTYFEIENNNTYNEFYSNIFSYYENLDIETGIRTYVTLQRYDEIGTKPYTDFSSIEFAQDNRVIVFDMQNISTTKYEIYDNYVMIIPDSIDFNEYYLTIHIEIKIRGINTKNMVIKRCELASFVSNDTIDTKIGTKASLPVYLYSEPL